MLYALIYLFFVYQVLSDVSTNYYGFWGMRMFNLISDLTKFGFYCAIKSLRINHGMHVIIILNGLSSIEKFGPAIENLKTGIKSERNKYKIEKMIENHVDIIRCHI